MPRTLAVCSLVMLTATAAAAQPPQPRRIAGTSTAGHVEMKGRDSVVDFATLQFSDGTDAPAFTVDFIVQYAPSPIASQGLRPIAAPSVVDIVITQHAADEAVPQTTLEMDGRRLPLVTRPRSARAVVASIPFDQFVALANADTIVERAFDAELEFGAGQLRTLREVAQRWSGR